MSALKAPASTFTAPCGLSDEIHFLRAVFGSTDGKNHVEFPPFSNNCRGLKGEPKVIAIAHPAPMAILAAISLVFIPPFDKPEPASPAIRSISGVTSVIVSNRRAVASSLGLAE